MDPRPDPRSFLPLRSVELDVLLGLADGPRHGYALLQAAEARADGHPGFEIPTLYRALRRMRDEELIAPVEAPEEEEDTRREYWRVTGLGRSVLEAELARLEVVLAEGRARLGSAEGGS